MMPARGLIGLADGMGLTAGEGGTNASDVDAPAPASGQGDPEAARDAFIRSEIAQRNAAGFSDPVQRNWAAAQNHLVDAATRAGIDADIPTRIAYWESRFSDTARPVARGARAHLNTARQFDGTMALSTAYGYGQMLDGAWSQALHDDGPRYGITRPGAITPVEAAAYRADPQLQAEMLAETTRRNMQRVGSRGGPDMAANVYALHNLGPSGGPAFLDALAATPDLPVIQALSARVRNNNPSLFGDGSITVRQAYQRMVDAMAAGAEYGHDAQALQRSRR